MSSWMNLWMKWMCKRASCKDFCEWGSKTCFHVFWEGFGIFVLDLSSWGCCTWQEEHVVVFSFQFGHVRMETIFSWAFWAKILAMGSPYHVHSCEFSSHLVLILWVNSHFFYLQTWKHIFMLNWFSCAFFVHVLARGCLWVSWGLTSHVRSYVWCQSGCRRGRGPLDSISVCSWILLMLRPSHSLTSSVLELCM